MSVPARTLRSPAPQPTRAPQPAREPSPRPRPSTAPQTRARTRTRRWHHPAFFLFAGIVVSVLVMGVVALNAMLVQTTYRMQTVRQQVVDLSQQQVQLADQVASLSSPENVARWAKLHGLTMPKPGDTIILPVRGVASTSDPARGANG
jgi:cell division protein FtsL